ncbi:hypothetical protein Fmac_011699 [Flemingia macrophylla]|uniref:Uncharacterized protein n=1 Tax=Flemingia macrophylla TaxID=520843 RepID=A0ABD1MN66_9FABA
MVNLPKKFGVEKFDPMNEPFDSYRHLVVFQIPDASKPPGTIASVLKGIQSIHTTTKVLERSSKDELKMSKQKQSLQKYHSKVESGEAL